MFTHADLLTHAVLNKVSLDAETISRLPNYLPLLNAINRPIYDPDVIGYTMSLDTVLLAAMCDTPPSEVLRQECPVLYGFWEGTCAVDLTDADKARDMVELAHGNYIGVYIRPGNMLSTIYDINGELPSGSTDDPDHMSDEKFEKELAIAWETIFCYDDTYYYYRLH